MKGSKGYKASKSIKIKINFFDEIRKEKYSIELSKITWKIDKDL